MINDIKTNQFYNEKTAIGHDFFKKFLDKIKEFKINNSFEIEALIEFSMNWDKSIDRLEIQLNFYSTSMIYFQNQEIVK